MPAESLITLDQQGVRHPAGADEAVDCRRKTFVSRKRKAHSTNPTFFIALK